MSNSKRSAIFLGSLMFLDAIALMVPHSEARGLPPDHLDTFLRGTVMSRLSLPRTQSAPISTAIRPHLKAPNQW
jgi:hypothetical protein